MLTRKSAAEVAAKIKSEVGKAGQAMIAVAVVAVVSLVISVVALLIGLGTRHANP